MSSSRDAELPEPSYACCIPWELYNQEYLNIRIGPLLTEEITRRSTQP